MSVLNTDKTSPAVVYKFTTSIFFIVESMGVFLLQLLVDCKCGIPSGCI